MFNIYTRDELPEEIDINLLLQYLERDFGSLSEREKNIVKSLVLDYKPVNWRDKEEIIVDSFDYNSVYAPDSEQMKSIISGIYNIANQNGLQVYVKLTNVFSNLKGPNYYSYKVQMLGSRKLVLLLKQYLIGVV